MLPARGRLYLSGAGPGARTVGGFGGAQGFQQPTPLSVLASVVLWPGTRAEKLRIQKWYTIYKDHITLDDYEIHDGMGLELYYN